MPATMSTSQTGRIEVTETGEGTPLVVFVHGVLDRGRSFDRVAGRLGGECRIVWYDRRGYGGSVDVPGGPVAVDRHVEDLLEVLDGRRAVVVGHSFGGVSALGAALRVPDQVAALVLYETGMAWLPGWDDQSLRSILWGEDPEGDCVRLMYGDRFEQMAPEDRALRLREARSFVAEERSVRTGTAPFDIGALEAPLVYGHSGGNPFDVVVEHLRSVVRHVEVVQFPGAGHNAHRSQPGPFADLVRRGISLAGTRGCGPPPSRASVTVAAMPETKTGEGDAREVTIFHNPSCSKSRGALGILEERSLPYDLVEYLKAPPSRATLEMIVSKLVDPVPELVRTTDKKFVELGLDPDAYQSAEEVVDLLLVHPELMQRPVVIRGDRAVIARPSERVEEVLA